MTGASFGEFSNQNSPGNTAQFPSVQFVLAGESKGSDDFQIRSFGAAVRNIVYLLFRGYFPARTMIRPVASCLHTALRAICAMARG